MLRYVLQLRQVLKPFVKRDTDFSKIVNFKFCGFCSEWFPLPFCACDRLRYLIVALPVHSVYVLVNFIIPMTIVLSEIVI